jgi:hypothetical protein
MLTAVDKSEFLFEWDLQDINLSQVRIVSPEFSFQGSKFIIRLVKGGGDINFCCFLKSVETLSKPGVIHFRFNLVNRLDNTITISRQCQLYMKYFHRGFGVPNWIDPSKIRDHILKVKIWTSEYDFECDLEKINSTGPSLYLPFFIYEETKLQVLLKKNEGGTKYGCYLEDDDIIISSKMRFQVDLYARLDNRLVNSVKREFIFNKPDVAQGFEDWFDVETIRDHVFKVKVWIFKPFSDFVEKPIDFENAGFLLFKKMSSNLSFLIGEEIVYAVHDILTSRSDYFRAMLEGSFKEAQVPMTVNPRFPSKELMLMCSR